MASQPFAGVQIQANNAHFCPRLVVRVRRRSPRLASGLASTCDDYELPAALIAAVSPAAIEQFIDRNLCRFWTEHRRTGWVSLKRIFMRHYQI
jgi:hypothetical protein